MTSTYTVLYTVTIAREVEAVTGMGALAVAMEAPALEGLYETEWGRDDITRVEVIAVDDTHLGVDDPGRIGVNL